jgi:CubicO group peptidase (beta-lactamase class C family)
MIGTARSTVRALLADAVAARVTPGAVVEIGSADAVVAVEVVGHLTYAAAAPSVSADTIYDLASLTKVIATTTLAMQHAAAGTLPLETPVAARLPGFSAGPLADATVADLLAHTAGLPAHRPYYRRWAGPAAFADAVAAEPLIYARRAAHEYTDLGFMVLGWLIEAAAGVPLAVQFDRWREAAMPGFPIGFGPVRGPAPVAPTEAERWRGRVLAGAVHDANAAALGGAAGHAGLFGTAAAVGAFARWFLGLWLQRVGSSAGVPASLAAQVARRGDVGGSSRALGWDTMLPTSSCGRRFSPTAIGHTGFTGTSLWIDPVRQLYVVLLTNRVHPAVTDAGGIQALRVAVHDAVAEDWRP